MGAAAYPLLRRVGCLDHKGLFHQPSKDVIGVISYAVIKTHSAYVQLPLFREYINGYEMPVDARQELIWAGWECQCGCESVGEFTVQIRANDHSVISEHKFSSPYKAYEFLSGVALAANHARFIDRAYDVHA